jgi:hypothetical protein
VQCSAVYLLAPVPQDEGEEGQEPEDQEEQCRAEGHGSWARPVQCTALRADGHDSWGSAVQYNVQCRPGSPVQPRKTVLEAA